MSNPNEQRSYRTPHIEQGLRFNDNKLRYDLMEPFAQQELARVFTFGAKKYAANNWLKGMDWTKCLASLKRHVAEWELGQDFDDETKCFHMAHAAWNALALVSYVKHAPQFDDRFVHTNKKFRKIGLDIDEVLCNFTHGWANQWPDVAADPQSWYYDRNIIKRFDAMREEGTLNDFYINLKPLSTPQEIPCEVTCYITSRPVETWVSEAWLDKYNFPQRPVITVPVAQSKVEIAKQMGLDVFVDDKYETFVEMNKAGILCFLYDAPHNQRYDVGFKRIKNLNELKHL